MRWCTSNFICRFLHRHTLAISAFFIILVCVNQVLHFKRSASPTCYQIVSPFISIQSNHTHNVNNNRSFSSNDAKAIPPAIHWSQGRLDNRRMLKIYEWVWAGSLWEELMNRFNVCLATQGSIDRIASIGEVSEKWLGPISLAVYIRTSDEWIILNLFNIYMQRCSALFTQTVSIHVAVPVNYEPMNSPNDSSRFEFSPWYDHPCGQPSEFLSLLMKKLLPDGIDQGALYPQNHMRNIARKTCTTSWVFMTDVDIIPRPNSSLLLQEFYESPSSKCSKCAFVIPVYELERSARYPETKRQLIDYANSGLARQFHLKIYRFGHWATNYSMWVSTYIEEGPVQISHMVDPRMNHYEPFYVSSDVIPAHDERFIGYGFTRSSQVLEARVTGWKFLVLTPIFAIHWGLQTPQSLRQPILRTPQQIAQIRMRGYSFGANPRKSQNSHNHIVYTDFVAELMAKKNISVARHRKKSIQQQRKDLRNLRTG
ncbi:unnamed protein product [Allacma fusca]|uniref:Beta-1,4-glucuronyltransferase 1 n=1 Tax=Allacma fusca TaxID=39272 RepID=A0A8J2K9F9_9HEXA|nr:unnamed protein product [Allacma fusca]